MVWQYYLVWLGIATVVTFITYGYDKTQAKNGGWRVPETVLHWMALLGGFFGGWAGRFLFRHKTRKASFTFILVASTLIHFGLGYWLYPG